ncbi:MAG: hypothetical protein JOZ92_04165 [Candidatus Dormibacteraeota bacterium]|nr:hypothetical protein [Candidatus Dormibacteraeota bacterium]
MKKWVRRVRRPGASIAIAFAMVLGFSVAVSPRAFAAGTLTNISWAVNNNQASAASTTYAYSFTTATTGTIKTITFTVSGSGLAGTPAIVAAYGIGAGSVARSGQVITYTVTSPVSVANGIPILIQLSGNTNPAAGSYTTAIATNTAAPAVIDSGTSPSITFASNNTAKTIVVAQSLTFTLSATSFQLNMDPSLAALADQSYTMNLTVLTNANSGYTMTVSDNATGLQCSCAGNPTIPQVSTQMSTAVAWPAAPANDTGYTVTGTGTGDAGFSVNAAFSAGTKYAGYRNVGDVVASSTTATGATANTIAVTDQTAVDYATASGTFTDTIVFTATPNYS